tara:strand:+ start:376 stop:939 length:564 start_codon:yes stop_codon:yes gene_type:complete
MSEAKLIWETLSAINVNEHKKSKGKFDYLPWNYAWATLMEHYPSAIFRELPDQVHGDGSVTVHTEMEINSITRPMWLAVTDHKNQAIQNPSCDDISDARMRCFTKNMSMFGLGFYIYQGEGVPQAKAQTITPEQAREIVDLMSETNTLKEAFCTHFKVGSVDDLSTRDFDRAITMLNAKLEKQGGDS